MQHKVTKDNNNNRKPTDMKTSTYCVIITVIAITSLGANAWTLNNIRNIKLTREACSVENNVALRNCQLKVVNVTPKADSHQMTLLMPPELLN